jgi:hypothetical protein
VAPAKEELQVDRRVERFTSETAGPSAPV